jgi:hypothetical protein
MNDTQPRTRRDTELDLTTLRLERGADGRLWLKHDGEGDPWFDVIAQVRKPDDAGAEAASKAGGSDKSGGDEDKVDVAADGVAVRIAPCFPWSRAGRYISVRTTQDKEIALISDLDELGDETRRLVEEALGEIGFVFEITRVESITTDIEVRNWKVRTRQGPFTFQTKLDEWPVPLHDGRSDGKDTEDADASPGTLLLRDVAGNLFLIPDPRTLDQQSRKLLWPFVG